MVLRHAEIGGSCEREQSGGDGHRGDESDAPPHQRAPPVAREGERAGKQQEDERDEHDARPVEQVHGAAGLLELTGVEQLDLEVLLLLPEAVEHRDTALVEPLDDLVDFGREVEDHLVVLDGDALALVGQCLDDESVGTPVGVLPHGRELLGREGARRGLLHEGLDARADGAGEELRPVGEGVLRLRFDVDFLEQTVGGALGHHVGDGPVLRQRRHRVDVMIGVENEVADPDGQSRQGYQHHAHDHEDRDEGPPPARQPLRGLCGLGAVGHSAAITFRLSQLRGVGMQDFPLQLTLHHPDWVIGVRPPPRCVRPDVPRASR